MNSAIPECLTDAHLRLFGTIIQWFARHELLMQEIMAAVAGSDSAAIMLLTSGLDFGGKRDALLTLLRHRAIPDDQVDRVYDHLLVPHTLTPLRNDIAHSAWLPGPSSNSIQPDWILHLPPSVRPLRDGLDAPSKGFVWRDQDEAIYTLDDLNEIAGNLAENYRRFSDYLRDVGLIRST